MATFAAYGEAADWFRNASAAPAVEVWLPDGWWEAEAVDVSAVPDRMALVRAVLIGSGFAAYAAGINARRWSDARLKEKTQGYRLLRLVRSGARTGPGGPGDQAWVWPLATAVVLIGSVHRWWQTNQGTST